MPLLGGIQLRQYLWSLEHLTDADPQTSELMVNELCPIRDLSDACWHKITTVDMTVSDMKKAKIRGGLVSVSADQENATHQSKKKKKLDLKITQPSN